MRAIVRVPATLDFAAIDAVVAKLSAGGECDLSFPAKIKHGQFGSAAALLQLIFTWARLYPHAAVLCGGDEESLARFIAEDHGLAATLVAGAVHSNDDERRDLTRDALALARERLAGMDRVAGARRGEKVFISCADHFNRGAPQTLYRRTAETSSLRTPQGYESLVRELFSALIRGEGTRRDPGDETVRHVASAMRELVANTFRWGAFEVERGADHLRPLPRSVRGVRVVASSHELKDNVSIAKEPALRSYLLREHAGSADAKQQRILEISIFDSGPGIASRVLYKTEPARFEQWPFSTPVSLDEEAEAIKTCLEMRFTTSVSSYRGDGLHQVMGMVSALDGFLILRSGRLRLHRNFLVNRYHPKNDFEPYLFDWEKPKRLEFTEYPPVWGSVVTFLFPAFV